MSAAIRLKDIATLAPCANCPFRSDVHPFIAPERVEDILLAASRGDTFACHKTVDYDRPKGAPDPSRRTCAGFVILLRKAGRLDDLTIVQVAGRLSGITFDAVAETAPVYASPEAMLSAHRQAAGPKGSRRRPRPG